MAETPEHAARVLGLDVSASMEEVRRARRALAKKYHPDRHPDATTASRHMARVNAATDTLIDYIIGRAKHTANGRRPEYKDFAQSRTTQSENRSRPDSAQDAKATAADPQAKRPSPDRAPRHMMVSAPVAAERDNDLIRLAARSYRTVLQQIAQPNAAPTVDARALRFTSAA